MTAARQRLRWPALAAAAWLAVAAPAQALGWRQLAIGTERQIDIAFDDSRGRMVCLRGDQTVEWDGFAWQTRSTGHRPDSRHGARTVFDAVRGRVLLFGGIAGSVVFPDLWEYDGFDWTRRAATPAPMARTGHAMAFDGARGRAIVFGGNLYGGALLGDTWEWDGNAWTQASGAGPVPRNEVSMAWHPGTGRTILFGGADSMLPRADTWAWDGVGWQQLAPATTPLRRSNHRIVTDFARGCLVMFGGADPTTWEWWGSDWVAGPPGPGMRVGFGFAHDGSTGQNLLYGGTTAAISTPAVVTMGDTWVYGGAGWLQVAGGGPQPRQGAGVTYDAARDRLVLHGSGDPLTTPTHTWEWDAAGWREIAGPGEPPYLLLTRMCHDRARGVSVLFGGMIGLFSQNTVHEWDGTNWRQPVVTLAPAPRWDHAMCYDRVRAHILMFGGRTLPGVFGDTWAWNGSTWTPLAVTGPSPRAGHGLCYDVARDRTVLFGGLDVTVGRALADTWEWNGSAWSQRTSAHAPPGRFYHGMEHDVARARTVVAGGGGVGYLTDSWEWDGTDWSRAGDLAGDAFAPTLVWHDRLGAIVGLSSFISGTMLVSNDLWLGSPGVAIAGTVGAPCGSARALQLSPFGAPVLGRPGFRLDVGRMAAGAPFLLGVATDSSTVPVAGCALLRSGVVTVAGIASGSGFATVPAPVPAAPALLGLTAVFQAGSLDSGAPAGFGLTAIVVARVGA